MRQFYYTNQLIMKILNRIYFILLFYFTLAGCGAHQKSAVESTMDMAAPEKDEPQMMQSFSSQPITEEQDPPKDVVIDRVKLKGSPRGILTWRGDMPRDTMTQFDNVGLVEAKKTGDRVKVTFSANGHVSTLLDEPVTAGSTAQIGVFSHKYNPQSANNQLVIFYSASLTQMQTKVFTVNGQVPVSTAIPFNPSNGNSYTPVPYMEMNGDMFYAYQDPMYSIILRRFKYMNGSMTEVMQ